MAQFSRAAALTGSRLRGVFAAAAAARSARARPGGRDGWSRAACAAALAAGGAGAAVAVGAPTHSRCEQAEQPADRLQRWRSKSWNIKAGASPGFHMRSINPLLERHLPRLVRGLMPDESSPSVLVPLCGKSLDLVFLADQGCKVVGVEGVLRAIMEFATEQRMFLKNFGTRKVMSQGADGWQERVGFEAAAEFQGSRPGWVFKTGADGLGYYSDTPAVFRGKVRAGTRKTVPLHMLQGDYMDVTPALVAAATYEERGTFDAVYDRAALAALLPDDRASYAARTDELVRVGGRMLLVVVEYDQAKVPFDPTGRRWSPPPFSVSEADVRSLYPAGKWDLEVLERRDTDDLSGNPSFKDVEVDEVVYLLTKRAASEPAAGGQRFGLAALVVAAAAGLAGLSFGRC